MKFPCGCVPILSFLYDPDPLEVSFFSYNLWYRPTPHTSQNMTSIPESLHVRTNTVEHLTCFITQHIKKKGNKTVSYEEKDLCSRIRYTSSITGLPLPSELLQRRSEIFEKEISLLILSEIEGRLIAQLLAQLMHRIKCTGRIFLYIYVFLQEQNLSQYDSFFSSFCP